MSILAIGRYPGISVPVGFDNYGVPFGISFGGLKGSEPKLIEIAYEFEQATKVRKPPSFKPRKFDEDEVFMNDPSEYLLFPLSRKT